MLQSNSPTNEVPLQQKEEIDQVQDSYLTGDLNEVDDSDINFGRYFHVWVMVAPSRDVNSWLLLHRT